MCVSHKTKLRWVAACATVWSVRWGHRSQPTDASEARKAGSQDGCIQTLIRDTHHTAFPVFTSPQSFLTVMLLVILSARLFFKMQLKFSLENVLEHAPCECSSSIQRREQRHNGKVCTCLGTPHLTHFSLLNSTVFKSHFATRTAIRVTAIVSCLCCKNSNCIR